jgi:hypothetical protein
LADHVFGLALEDIEQSNGRTATTPQSPDQQLTQTVSDNRRKAGDQTAKGQLNKMSKKVSMSQATDILHAQNAEQYYKD